jgi:farnesyl-diphosphate farnesyltransferase
VQPQIALAYLLARATDTIADTGAISVKQRLQTLQRLQAEIATGSTDDFDLGEIRKEQSSEAEKILLARINDALRLLSKLDASDRQLVKRVLGIITSGQQLDLERFRNASREAIVSLRTPEELDDYTYRVAGCVGEFWTRMCVTRLNPKPRVRLEELIANGVRFGKGLQLVNILRDLPTDLRLGRCYLPGEDLALEGLIPEDLLDAANEQRVRGTYNRWLNVAEGHLQVGWSYVLDLPWSWARVRLATALPVLIGVKTLNKLRNENVLNPDKRIKVSREEVKRIFRLSLLFYPVKPVWRKLPNRIVQNMGSSE